MAKTPTPESDKSGATQRDVNKPGANRQPDRQKRSFWSLVAMAVGMFGFAFALVPLYNVFCDITGINGKTADTPTAASERVDTS
ncbi:hypothetical protein ACOV11_26180, partial [Vibrio natriegens]